MNDPSLKPAMFARLVYLDQCLTWRGQVNLKDLIQRFGISSPQAAIDFREYLERVAEPKPRYDAVRKCYLADSNHRGLPFTYEAGSPDELVRSPGSNDFSMLPSPVRQSPPFVMRQLYQAIEQQLMIEIDYVSMSTGLRQNHWIAPANFASDGERLHVRAWSFHHQERSNVEGVNLDEELVKLTTYQQAYAASARLLKAADDMYETLLNDF